MQKDFDEAFGPKQTVYEYIQKLQQWRTRYEKNLDSKPRIQPLDALSHYLTEFQYLKVDEIEVPGQYTEVCAEIYVSLAWLMFATGQGQQSKLHSYSKVWAKVRELPNAWNHMEAHHYSWDRQLENCVLDTTEFYTLLPPGRKGDADIPYFQRVSSAIGLLNSD
jgi:hypothetical protein